MPHGLSLGIGGGGGNPIQTPNQIFSGVSGTTILHWFDASDPFRFDPLYNTVIRDKRDTPTSQGGPTIGGFSYPCLKRNDGLSISTASINGVSGASLPGSGVGSLTLFTAGGSPIPTDIGASNSSFWTTNDTCILIAGVILVSNTGAVGAAGPALFSQNVSDTLTGRFLHCFRYYPNSAGTRGTSFVYRGSEQAIFDDTAVAQSDAFMFTFYQKTGTAAKLVLSSCSRYANFNSTANAGYNAANESSAKFRVGARMGSGGNVTAFVTGVFGELLIVTANNPVGTALAGFDDPSSSNNSKLLKNYFVSKWRLKEASYINI